MGPVTRRGDDMSSASSRETPTGTGHELIIASWPIRQEPGRSTLILGAITTVAGYTWYSTASGPIAALVLLALLASAWRLWTPVSFELGPRGLTERIGPRRRRIPWREISGYQIQERGVLLFADSRPGMVAYFRSLFIRYPSEPELLRNCLEKYLEGRKAIPAPRDSELAQATSAPPTPPRQKA
jgi:hypothetical protein